MREVYLVATPQAEPASLEALREAFVAEEVEFSELTGGWGFAIVADGIHVEVRFESREHPPQFDKDLLTGADESIELLAASHGFYRVCFDPGEQPSVAVFEALWCARNVLELVDGVVVDVTSSKVHDAADVAEITELDFDIRDHVNLHAVEVAEGDNPLWIHSHGMEKFGARDVEIFQLGEEDMLPAESFIHELCTDLAFGQGPPLRAPVETSAGDTFALVPSEEARVTLMGVSLSEFEGHEGLYLTVVSPGGRHNLTELLTPYRERFAQEPQERTEALRQQAHLLLPAFKARFQRRGLMEPMTFLVRAPFEVHPEDQPVIEHLWLEVLAWEEDKLAGKLVDGATHTTEWRKGAVVNVEERFVDAIAVGRDGRTLEQEEMTRLLGAERPM